MKKIKFTILAEMNSVRVVDLKWLKTVLFEIINFILTIKKYYIVYNIVKILYIIMN